MATTDSAAHNVCASCNCIPDVIDESIQNNEKLKSCMDEINRLRKCYEKRQALKRQKAIDVKPLYHEQMKRRDLIAKYPVYKNWYTYPKAKKPDPCKHVGNIILDRDILSKNEHISYLAQPKADHRRACKPPQWTFQRRFLPNCTSRVDSLSQPKTVRVQNNWHDYHNVLSIRQATNLRKTLQKPPLDYTSIENAITYIHEERRLKNVMKREAIRKCNQIKKKFLEIERKQMTKIICALYEVSKDYLVNDKFEMNSEQVNQLSTVIEGKITELCDCNDTNSASHVRQLLKTVSINLAFWIEKFTANCGFTNARLMEEQLEDGEAKSKCKEMDNSEFLLPIDDYISYKSASDHYVDAEEGLYEEDATY